MFDGAPAPHFVGRERERARLMQLLRRGHFAMVCGPGGIGKTALVRVTVSDLKATAFFHRCYRGDSLEELIRGLLPILGEDSPGLGDEELAAYAVECAEKSERFVVIDDLHHLKERDAERWCELISRFATASTWVFTSRRGVRLPEMQANTIELSPLSGAEATDLAKRCGLSEAPPHTGGVPFWIKQLAAAQNAGASQDARAFLDGLSPEAVRQLAMLSLMRDPVIEVGVHSELLEHGLATENEEPRLHDAVSDVMRASMSADEEQSAAHWAMSALSQSSSAASQLDALRICLERRETMQALTLLEGCQAWIDEGLGTRLWNHLVEEHDPAFAECKMRIAVDVGSRQSLDWLAEQAAPEGAARLDWAEGLLRSGRTRRALEVLRAGASDTPRASLLLGEAFCEAGEPEEGIRVLRSFQPADDELSLRRDTKLAWALFYADQAEAAKALLRTLEQRAADLSPRVRSELSAERSALRLQLGFKDDRRVEAAPALGSMGRVFQGIRLAASGRFGHSAEILAALRSIDLPASTSLLAGVVQGILRITRGRYDGLSSMAREMVLEAERLGNATLYHWSFMLERMVNLGSAATHPELEWAATIPLPTGIPQRYLQSLRVSHQARRGERVDVVDLPRAGSGDGPLVTCICDLTEANVCLLAGDADRAQLLAAAVTQRTARLGYFFFEGEALLIQCYAQLKLGRWSGLGHALDALETLSASLRSKRYASIARLLRLSFADRPSCADLLALGTEGDASPTVARVARTLMGAEASGDALDALITESLQARWTHRLEVLHGASGASWGFDVDAKRLALPGGEVSASPLALKLLRCLFEEPGGASLARIAEVVWGIEEFHQLRDSKRVHVAVRRLRTLLEEEPSSPLRLLTVEGGYALSILDAPCRPVPCAS